MVPQGGRKGQPDAQAALGVLYEQGKGVAADRERAADWYRKAAEQGLAKSAKQFGKLLQIGRWRTDES